MKYLYYVFAVVTFSFCISCNKNTTANQEDLHEKASELAKNILIIDTHIDLPLQLYREYYDVSVRNIKGEFDYVRAVQGGLNAAFMSIYIPAKYEEEGAKEHADTLINIVEDLQNKFPGKYVLADSPQDVKEQFHNARISLCLGMENGSPIEGDLKNLEYFFNRGIRYITLCHTKNNHICDSSGEDEILWNGLSPFGKEVVKEMNRLGIMVDLSHVSDSTFYQAVELSKVPVIASHSGCRTLTPGYARNMNDNMIKKLARHGGVIQIYYGSTLLNNEVRLAVENRRKLRQQYLEDHKEMEANEAKDKFDKENPPVKGSIEDIIKHIDHVVKLVGVEHVGLGSDFEGVDLLPEELSDVSEIPNLIYELLRSGYSEDDIRKICSGNILRVWQQAEDYASKLKD